MIFWVWLNIANSIWLVYGHQKVGFNGDTELTLSWIDIRGLSASCSDGEPISVSLHSQPGFVWGLLERAMNSAWPSFHYRPDWSVSKRQEGAGHGSTAAQVSWARGGKSCQSNWTYLLPIHSPRIAHVCCATLGSGSLYETDSAGAASFCMPLFSMTKAGMNIQQNCFCALSPPSMQLLMYLPEKNAVCLIQLRIALEMMVKLCQIFDSALRMTSQKIPHIQGVPQWMSLINTARTSFICFKPVSIWHWKHLVLAEL